MRQHSHQLICLAWVTLGPMQRRQPADVAFDVLGMLGGQIAIAMNGYRSGDTGAATAEIEVPRWQAWLAMLFPALRL